jgi:Zn-dependent protease with chaperone function
MNATVTMRRATGTSEGPRPSTESLTLFLLLAFLGTTFTALCLGWSPDSNMLASTRQNAPLNLTATDKTPVRLSERAEAADDKLLQEVFQKLLAVAGQNPGQFIDQYVWPPPVSLNTSGEVNAYASVCHQQEDGSWIRKKDPKTGQFLPFVVVYQGLLDDLAQRNPDRLAFILGHELAHLILGHVLNLCPSSAPTPTLATIFTAEQEHAADVSGMQLALAANFSIRGAREVWLRVMSDAFLQKQPSWRNYSSFEGVGFDHPAWTDRLALIDKEKETLWRAMSAFENGAFFLTAEQYAAAEESFRRVVDPNTGFPNSYDAWADLGHALLMQYFDKLAESDIARFDIGQLVAGSFYIRPKTLEPKVKGIDTELWNEAVTALKKALELKPSATLAEANLGMAYLLAPTGKNAREATRFLEQAAANVDADKGLTIKNRAAVLINSEVALQAGGHTELAKSRLRVVEDMLGNAEMYPALKYNRALLLSLSGNPKDSPVISSLLTDYLETESPASLWWNAGYELYATLSKKAGLHLKSTKEFTSVNQAQHTLRPVTSVEVGRGLLITLSDPITIVNRKLGAALELPVVSGTNLVRLFYKQYGIELLGTRRVVAIFLRGANAPQLQIRRTGTGSPVSQLRVGMTESDVEAILGNYHNVAPLNDPNVLYNFYPEVGVAVRYNTDNRINELVIAQITVQR